MFFEFVLYKKTLNKKGERNKLSKKKKKRGKRKIVWQGILSKYGRSGGKGGVHRENEISKAVGGGGAGGDTGGGVVEDTDWVGGVRLGVHV